MTSWRPGRKLLFVLLTIGSLLLVGVVLACAPQPAQPQKEVFTTTEMSAIQAQTAVVLTAWPTPPSIITRPPSPTAAPRALWTAPSLPGPSPTWTALASSPRDPTPSSAALASSTTPAGVPAATAAPVGSNPPPVRLIIPGLGLDVPVEEVSWDVSFADGSWQSVWQTASGAAGHHRNSANPGESGNVVISGHHNTRGEVFREVSEIGRPDASFGLRDEIVLVASDGRRYTYMVVQWERFEEETATRQVRQEHGRYLDQTSEARLTLVTCWPYESNSHRVVVIAELQP